MLYVLILLIINASLTLFMYLLTKIPIVAIMYMAYIFVNEALIYFAYKILNNEYDFNKCDFKVNNIIGNDKLASYRQVK